MVGSALYLLCVSCRCVIRPRHSLALPGAGAAWKGLPVLAHFMWTPVILQGLKDAWKLGPVVASPGSLTTGTGRLCAPSNETWGLAGHLHLRCWGRVPCLGTEGLPTSRRNPFFVICTLYGLPGCFAFDFLLATPSPFVACFMCTR